MCLLFRVFTVVLVCDWFWFMFVGFGFGGTFTVRFLWVLRFGLVCRLVYWFDFFRLLLMFWCLLGFGWWVVMWFALGFAVVCLFVVFVVVLLWVLCFWLFRCYD